ncbi:hypothetical protein JB92DRAFT_1434961 [Gautieria morchelliformis]|nr:hypothetical protein JB92DRAFT_1434961 [Gautieria morchelliformis]
MDSGSYQLEQVPTATWEVSDVDKLTRMTTYLERRLSKCRALWKGHARLLAPPVIKHRFFENRRSLIKHFNGVHPGMHILQLKAAYNNSVPENAENTIIALSQIDRKFRFPFIRVSRNIPVAEIDVERKQRWDAFFSIYLEARKLTSPEMDYGIPALLLIPGLSAILSNIVYLDTPNSFITINLMLPESYPKPNINNEGKGEHTGVNRSANSGAQNMDMDVDEEVSEADVETLSGSSVTLDRTTLPL